MMASTGLGPWCTPRVQPTKQWSTGAALFQVPRLPASLPEDLPASPVAGLRGVDD